MFVAMNNFKVASGKEEEFERIWKTRESYLAGVPGFVRFALLRVTARATTSATARGRAAMRSWRGRRVRHSPRDTARAR